MTFVNSLFRAISELAAVGESATSGDFGRVEPKARVQHTRFGLGGAQKRRFAPKRNRDEAIQRVKIDNGAPKRYPYVPKYTEAQLNYLVYMKEIGFINLEIYEDKGVGLVDYANVILEMYEPLTKATSTKATSTKATSTIPTSTIPTSTEETYAKSFRLVSGINVQLIEHYIDAFISNGLPFDEEMNLRKDVYVAVMEHRRGGSR